MFINEEERKKQARSNKHMYMYSVVHVHIHVGVQSSSWTVRVCSAGKTLQMEKVCIYIHTSAYTSKLHTCRSFL